MPPSTLSQDRSDQHQYLRFLKRRQRTSLWLEGLASGAVVAALVCFIAEQLTGVVLAWWLGAGSLFLALVAVVTEALDASIEHRWRSRPSRQQEIHGHLQQLERGAMKGKSRMWWFMVMGATILILLPILALIAIALAHVNH